jgi:hypothetical protein
MKHTPGPWTVDLSETNGHIGWSVFGGDRHVATVYVNILSSRDKKGDTAANPENAESVSNASLIAAAPQLLEACKAAHKWLDYFGGHVPVVAGGEAELSGILEAAIAAAEGREK